MKFNSTLQGSEVVMNFSLLWSNSLFKLNLKGMTSTKCEIELPRQFSRQTAKMAKQQAKLWFDNLTMNCELP